MYFRAQRKTSGEVHLGDAIEIDKDGNPLTLQDVIRDERDMEQELLAAINGMDLGPAGLGGRTSALAVHIETFPTHIDGLAVAVNICCHAYRHSTVTL